MAVAPGVPVWGLLSGRGLVVETHGRRFALSGWFLV